MSSRKIFEKFDKNKDNKLSLDEFREAILSFSTNIPHDEIVKLFEEIDVDGDGELDANEFTSFIDNLLKEAFTLCDADGDGKITASEFYGAMIGIGKECTEEDCAKMVRAAGADGGGYLNLDEFIGLVIGDFTLKKE